MMFAFYLSKKQTTLILPNPTNLMGCQTEWLSEEVFITYLLTDFKMIYCNEQRNYKDVFSWIGKQGIIPK